MGITIIIKETSADRRRRVYASGNPLNGPIEGRTKSVDEAHDLAYHAHGDVQQAFLVEGGPEVQQAAYDNARGLLQRSGDTQTDPADVVKQWSQ